MCIRKVPQVLLIQETTELVWEPPTRVTVRRGKKKKKVQTASGLNKCVPDKGFRGSRPKPIVSPPNRGTLAQVAINPHGIFGAEAVGTAISEMVTTTWRIDSIPENCFPHKKKTWAGIWSVFSVESILIPVDQTLDQRL